MKIELTDLIKIVKELQENEITMSKISNKFGVSNSLISKVNNGHPLYFERVRKIYKGEFPIRPSGFSNKGRNKRIIEDYKNGLSYEELADKYFLSIYTILKIVDNEEGRM